MPSFDAMTKFLHACYLDKQKAEWVSDYYAFNSLRDGTLGNKFHQEPILGNPYFIKCDKDPAKLKPEEVKKLYDTARDDYDKKNPLPAAPKNEPIEIISQPKPAQQVVRSTWKKDRFTAPDAQQAYNELYKIYSRLAVTYVDKKGNQEGIEKRRAFKDLMDTIERYPKNATLKNIREAVDGWKETVRPGAAKTNYAAVSTSTGYTNNFFINPTSQRKLDSVLESMTRKTTTQPEPGSWFSRLTGR